jgi:hypothetical protein
MWDVSIFDHLPKSRITMVPLDEMDVTVQVLDNVNNTIELLVIVKCEITQTVYVIVHTNTGIPTIY